MMIDQIMLFQPDDPITPQQFAQQNLKRLRLAYQLVRENLLDARLAHKTQYDRRARNRIFEIGDRVLKDVRVVKKGHSKKFTPKYVGPYRVIEVLTDLTVRIQAEGQPKSELIHVNRIKPLHYTEIWKDEPSEPFIYLQDTDNDGANEDADDITEETPPAEAATEAAIILPAAAPAIIQAELTTPASVERQPTAPVLARQAPPIPERRAGLRPRNVLVPNTLYPEKNYVLDSGEPNTEI